MNNTTYKSGIDYRSAAKFIFENAEKEGIDITALSVQKLLYLAHGLMLAKFNKSLLDQRFQAWKYGPVIEPLYHELKVFGSIPIKANSFWVDKWPDLDVKNTENEIYCLKSVLKQFGKTPAFKLVNITHDSTGPWAKVYHSHLLGIEIEDDEIKKYFETKLVRKS